jgi:hypothetical protein
MLDEEHRGFRLVVIDCCTYMVNSLSNFKSHAVLYEHVNQIVVELLEKVNTQDQTLYRKKADLISLISQILPHYSDKELQRTVLKCLLRMWRDPDSEVRHVSINMVQVILSLIIASRRTRSRRSFGCIPRPRIWFFGGGFTYRYNEGASSINQQR